MRVLGVDPGLLRTGYGCVEPVDGALEPRLVEAGVIRLRATDSVATRLVELERDLAEIVERLAPACVCVEKLFAHYKHPRTAITMAHARGVVLLVARRAALHIEEVQATEVKKSLTGHGHASKAQVQESVRAQLALRETPRPPDVADAIAIALCAARRVASPDALRA
jgi:crossover junction endodeoxyribonuclease RuvC